MGDGGRDGGRIEGGREGGRDISAVMVVIYRGVEGEEGAAFDGRDDLALRDQVWGRAKADA